MRPAPQPRRPSRHLVVAAALLCSACATNMLGRGVRVDSGTYASGGHSRPYWTGTPEVANADRLPLVVFLEGDGSMCQEYSPGLWRRFLERYTGDYVLVRPVTQVNATCDTEAFRGVDFLHRVDELASLVLTLGARHPSRPIYLVGHSAGAHLALLYASASDARVRGIVNLGGGLDALAQVIPDIERGRAKRGELDAPELTRRLADIDELVRRVGANGSSTEPHWGRTLRFWHQMFFSGVGALWRATRLPVLVVHGEDDLESVPSHAVHAAADELAAAQRSNVHFVFLPGVGHDLLRRDVFRLVNAWIAEQELQSHGVRSPAP